MAVFNMLPIGGKGGLDAEVTPWIVNGVFSNFTPVWTKGTKGHNNSATAATDGYVRLYSTGSDGGGTNVGTSETISPGQFDFVLLKVKISQFLSNDSYKFRMAMLNGTQSGGWQSADHSVMVTELTPGDYEWFTYSMRGLNHQATAKHFLLSIVGTVDIYEVYFVKMN